ncbi:MAG: three-Cys-motif partner protein TcmP [Planctomycetota bacterium]|nr:three-Cys-motif partner protein TcmP [Planctomycetota bacterium]
MRINWNAYDRETKLKLEIFRGYIREWLPVFLAGRSSFKTVALYDFFAGPGRDVEGEKGSPLIIIDELKAYLSNPKTPKVQGVEIRLYFNDDKRAKYLELKEAIEEENISNFFNVEVDNKDFTAAFNEKFNLIAAANTANLVILDQSGIKHITQDVFKKLMGCKATDILFFISSSTVKRFAGEDCIDQYFPGITKEQIDGLDADHIHRFVCKEYYRKLVSASKEYYLAPFSIKKDSNVYGLIFGSGSLYGLEKFLNVCWKLDPKTGEANYNIDRDPFRKELSIFPEDNIMKKCDEFEKKLIAEIKKGGKTNNDIYKYCLENGFLPTHVNNIFKKLQKEGILKVFPETTRPGAFYINWNNYKTGTVKVEFAIRNGGV